jgi:hypothetical protein
VSVYKLYVLGALSALLGGCGPSDHFASAESEDIGSVSQALCAATQLSVLSVTSSSSENAGTPATAAVDGNLGTRWSSAHSDPQWLRLDLGQVRYVDSLALNWETASAADYRVELSVDGVSWQTAKTITGALAGARTDTLTGLAYHTARYVRIYGTRRTSAWGYSLWEARVNGDANPSCASAGRSISARLEAESNDGMSGLAFEGTADAGGGQNAGWVDAGDYVQWQIEVPSSGSYKLSARSATTAAATLSFLVDGSAVANLSLPNTGGWQSWQTVTSGSVNLTAGTHTLRALFTSAGQNLNWVKVDAAANELEVGLWRIASRADRTTTTRSDADGVLRGADYTGHPRQQWRLRARGAERYELAHESTGQCLTAVGPQLQLGACGNSGIYWTLETLRARSEERPAVYRLRSPANTCLLPAGFGVTTVGACNGASDLYIEPVGYGERSRPMEFELRALMIVKQTTAIASPSSYATIPADRITAAQTSFTQHVATWIQRITDGRVRWVAESVISPDPFSNYAYEGTAYLPSAATQPADVQRYLTPRGKYDNATVFFTGGQVDGGWGWGPGASPESNYVLWATVNGGHVDASRWISWETEPTEVFIHEPLHGLEFLYGEYGVPLPDGYLHSAEAHGYAAENGYGWLPWYRDYYLGTVIGADDTYRGLGPRAFRLGTPRQLALTKP